MGLIGTKASAWRAAAATAGPFASLLAVLIGALYFIIAVNLQYLPVHGTFVANADVLFIEDVARSLNAGSYLQDWRLTQAPYLFPDILLARLLAHAGAGTAAVAVHYHAIFGVLLAACVFWLCLLARVKPLVPVATTALLYSLSYTGGLGGFPMAMYFGLIGHHAGVMLPLAVALAASAMYFRQQDGGAATLALLFCAVFLGVISDSLLLAAFFPMAFVFSLLLAWRQETTLARLGTWWGFLACAAILGKAYGLAIPFPQDREFMQWVLHQFPSLTVASLRKFPRDFLSAVRSSPVAALIALLFLASAAAAVRHLLRLRRAEASAATVQTLLAVFILVSPLTVIAAQLVIGLYGGMDSTRQWLPVVFVAIAGGAILACADAGRPQRFVLPALCGVALVFSLATVAALAGNKGRTAPPNPYAALVECMDREAAPEGWRYIADYWIARPVRLFSEGRYGAVAYGATVPFTNASNLAWTRKAAPEFVITGSSVDKAGTIARLGEPSGSFCAMAVGGYTVEILDYRKSGNARQVLREQAANAY